MTVIATAAAAAIKVYTTNAGPIHSKQECVTAWTTGTTPTGAALGHYNETNLLDRP